MNANVTFLMFRFDLMLMDSYNGEDNNSLFDEIIQKFTQFRDYINDNSETHI